jgi:hypothetical protein
VEKDPTDVAPRNGKSGEIICDSYPLEKPGQKVPRGIFVRHAMMTVLCDNARAFMIVSFLPAIWNGTSDL